MRGQKQGAGQPDLLVVVLAVAVGGHDVGCDWHHRCADREHKMKYLPATVILRFGIRSGIWCQGGNTGCHSNCVANSIHSSAFGAADLEHGAGAVGGERAAEHRDRHRFQDAKAPALQYRSVRLGGFRVCVSRVEICLLSSKYNR